MHLSHGDTASGRHMVSSAVSQRSSNPLARPPVLYAACFHHVAASEDSEQQHSFSNTFEDDLMADGA